MTTDILDFTSTMLKEGHKVALLTVTATQGSSPATVGQMMAVLEDGTTKGTVGGGSSEYQLTQRAIQAIGAGEKSFPFALNHAQAGMTCGGSMEGFGTVQGGHNQLILFGAGHVAQSLAPLAQTVGFSVTVVEDRAELAEHFSEVNYVVTQPESYESAVHLTGEDYVVVCTRGHASDGQAVRFCLNHSTKYLGMIGSKKKVAHLFGQLREEGVSEEVLGQIYSPIGLDIASSVPAEIAVSILAEILMVKNQGKPGHKRSQV